MTALYFLTGIMSFCFLYLSVDCRTLLQTIDQDTFQPLCSRTCNSSSEELVSEMFPKYLCSCSPSCAVYGDCCYDSPHLPTNQETFEFICLSVVGRGQYKAVSSCPPDKRSDFCKEALGYQPPVTSRVTNITYGNIFCAVCNGDGDKYLTWNVELRCPSENENETEELSSDKTRIIYDSGEFWRLNEIDRTKGLCKFYVHYDDFNLLDGLEVRPCNTLRKISRCSATWNELSVIEKCRSYEDPIYFHDTPYKNPHCAQCNYLNLEYSDCVPFYVKNMLQMKLIDPSVQEFCKMRGSEACIRSLSEMNKGRSYSISHLVNIKVNECVPPDCCPGQRYDFRTKKCRRVISRPKNKA